MCEIEPTHTRRHDPNDLLDRLGIDPDVTMRFFVVFSCFEFALKRAGYASRRRRKDVVADWDGFGRRFSDRFFSAVTDEVLNAVRYLTENPPRKEVLNDWDELDWEDAPCADPTSLLDILIIVRRVRNNLFHGGKFPSGPVPFPGRDRDLVCSCILVLEACIPLDSAVADRFAALY